MCVGGGGGHFSNLDDHYHLAIIVIQLLLSKTRNSRVFTDFYHIIFMALLSAREHKALYTVDF